MSDRRQLERQLLRDPFDESLRERYAECLFGEGQWDASLEQWLLLVRQAPTAARHLRAAECCERLGQHTELEQHLHAARGCPDFDETDVPIAAAAGAAKPGQLVAIPGGRPAKQAADVVAITSTDRVRLSDVVGLDELKRVIRLRIVEPFANPGLFARFRKRSGGGVLLYGPPGCGKTLVARAIASELEASFTPVGISDVLNMWVGGSEHNLAAVFDKARAQAPSVLFFDELDALAFSRSKAHSDHTRTLVNEFLSQLDGMHGRNERVLILAATNMPWDVDEAMKRPGRFDRQVFVPPPDADARAEMFRIKLCGVPTEGVDCAELGARARRFSGADIDGVLERAKDAVLADILDAGNDERPLRQADLLAALESMEPSTMDWLKTARNLVKFGGAGSDYKDVERYLRAERLY